MKLPRFFKELEPKDRLLAILVVGAVVVGVVYVMPASDQSVIAQSPPQVAGNIVAAPQKPVMPIGYQPGMTVKDPFAIAPEYVPPSPAHEPAEGISMPPRNANDAAAGQQAVRAEKAKSQLPEVRLTGVAKAEGRRVAIIQLGNKSQPYAINEYIGPYKLLDVQEDSAILSGPDGQRVIKLGR